MIMYKKKMGSKFGEMDGMNYLCGVNDMEMVRLLVRGVYGLKDG